MRREILKDNIISGARLPTGWYNIEKADEGTDKQNRLFHALIGEYYHSGMHSYDCSSFEHFRALIKYNHGVVEKYKRLIDDNGWRLDKPKSDYRLKSWADYTKKERQQTIDNVISEMLQAGADNTPKMQEILKEILL